MAWIDHLPAGAGCDGRIAGCRAEPVDRLGSLCKYGRHGQPLALCWECVTADQRWRLKHDRHHGSHRDANEHL